MLSRVRVIGGVAGRSNIKRVPGLHVVRFMSSVPMADSASNEPNMDWGDAEFAPQTTVIDIKQQQVLDSQSSSSSSSLQGAMMNKYHALEQAIVAAESDQWAIITAMQVYFSSLESALGWTGAIVGGTLLIRAAILPLFISQQRATVRQRQYAPQLFEMTQKWNKLRQEGDMHGSMQAMMERKKFMAEKKIRLRDMLKPTLVTMPVFGSTFFALRSPNLFSAFPEMTTAGILTFQDLTVRDPAFVLPFIAAYSIFMQMHLTPLIKGNALMAQVMTAMKFFFPPLFFLAACANPASVGLYWAVNSSVTLGQSILFRNDKFRRLCGMPTMDELDSMIMPTPELNVFGPHPNSPITEAQVQANQAASKVLPAPTNAKPMQKAAQPTTPPPPQQMSKRARKGR